MVAIGGENAAAHWTEANTGTVNSDINKDYKSWVMNGGKTTDQSGKSVYGSKWGTTYDKAADDRDKAVANLYTDSQAATPDAGLIALDKDTVARMDTRLDFMNKNDPPSGKQTLRSIMGRGLPAPGSVVAHPNVAPPNAGALPLTPTYRGQALKTPQDVAAAARAELARRGVKTP